MRLKQPGPAQNTIRLVPMIDVLMIMLIFFMVTSTYLNLRMIPMVTTGETPAADAGTASGTVGGTPRPSTGTLLLRLDPTGQTLLHGEPVTRATLAQVLAARLADNPDLNVVLLPSGRARTQDLVTLLDTATAAGVRRLRVIRLGQTP